MTSQGTNHTPRRGPGPVVLATCVVSLIAVVGVLASLIIDRSPTTDAGNANLRRLAWLWLASAFGWVALTLVWRRLAQAPPMPAGPRVWMLMLGVAMLARVAVVATHDPGLSDDIHRYTFDGATLASGVNPYLATPLERVDATTGDPTAARWVGEADVAALVNNPELHTIYLPTSQLVFGGVGLITPDSMSEPLDRARWMRWIFILIDAGVIGLILLTLSHLGRSPWWAALYAWHPLPIIEIAGSGHQDVIGVALLLLALLLWARRREHVIPWTIALALASLVKPFVLPVAVMILKGRAWRHWFVSAGVGAVVCLALTAPMLLSHDRAPLDNLSATTTRFSLKWAHFGSVYEPVLWTIETVTNDPADAWQRPDDGLWTNDEQERLARGVCLVLVLAVVLLVFLSPTDIWTKTRIMMLAMVLFSSTAHPWYLLWALAIVPMAPSPTVWLASLTLPWGYAQLGDVVEWETSPWVMVAAYVPIYLVLAWDLARTWGHSRVVT